MGRRALGWLLLAAATGGCAGGGGPPAASIPQSRPGTTVVALEFLHSHENEAAAGYYPINGIAGCAYAPDGTLIFCDEQRGRIHALDPQQLNWYEFDTPLSQPYTPLDVRIDGFKILALDAGGARIYRFDLAGSLLDVAVDLDQLEPGYPVLAAAFDIDQDGRMVVADAGSQQVLLLDSFLSLSQRLGGPGTQFDQFNDPAGIVFLPDGSFLVSDRGNSRLNLYGRLGFYERSLGDDFSLDRPFLGPQGLDRDRFGNVFVADPLAGKVHVLDAALAPCPVFGADDSLDGVLQAPIDVAVGPGNLLAVTDRVRAAVLVYRIHYE